MKPGFALDLAHDGLRLLARRAEGWVELGRAEFGADNFDQSLAMLRGLAETHAPGHVATKLILPASQILYSEVDAPGPDRAQRRAQIETALQGRTPYAVADLVFDWSRIGPEVHVAVVARVTLDEAEEFAEAHGFNPVSFVAIPGHGDFAGEPFFGLTSGAGAYIPEGERLDRDQDPVRIVDLPDHILLAPVPADTPPAQVDATPVEDADAPDVAEDPHAYDEVPMPIGPALPAPANITAPLPPEDPDEDAAGVDPTEALIRPSDLAATLAPDPGAGGLDAPFIALDDLDDLDRALDEEDTVPAFASRRMEDTDEIAEDSTPIAGRSRLTLALADATTELKRRSEDAPNQGIAAADLGVTAPVLLVPQPGTGQNAGAAYLGQGGGRIRQVSTPMAEAKHGTQAQQKIRHGHGAAGLEPAKPGRSVFGATLQGASRAIPGLNARQLGVAVAMLVVVALALWWIWFLAASDTAGSSAALTPERSQSGQVASLPDTDGSGREIPPDAMPDPTEAIVPSETAIPDPAEAESAALAEAEAGTAAIPDIAPPVADTIWATGPVAATGPEVDAAGAPPIAKPGPGPEAALPASALDAAGAGSDTAPLWQPVPPPYGTVFEFLPDGSILPSPEGIVTPDGITLVAGRPPVTPTRRPGNFAPETALEPAPEAEPEDAAIPQDQGQISAAVQEAMATAEGAETPLPAPVNPALDAKKPRARPAEVIARAVAARAAAEAAAAAEAEAERAREAALASATRLAVATSRRPLARPSGLARAVEDAVAAAVAEAVTTRATPAEPVPETTPSAAETGTAELDEPEPIAPTPNIPTSVTVAKQATIKNALDLGEISLIGVFGSSANRRALVRMPTGRMIKLKIGDRLDGGQVAAIGDSELSYVKRGRTYVLKMLKKS